MLTCYWGVTPQAPLECGKPPNYKPKASSNGGLGAEPPRPHSEIDLFLGPQAQKNGRSFMKDDKNYHLSLQYRVPGRPPEGRSTLSFYRPLQEVWVNPGPLRGPVLPRGTRAYYEGILRIPEY